MPSGRTRAVADWLAGWHASRGRVAYFCGQLPSLWGGHREKPAGAQKWDWRANLFFSSWGAVDAQLLSTERGGAFLSSSRHPLLPTPAERSDLHAFSVSFLALMRDLSSVVKRGARNPEVRGSSPRGVTSASSSGKRAQMSNTVANRYRLAIRTHARCC